MPFFGGIRTALDWVSVKWFGAKGDGVTNDTAAIVAARQSVNTGGTIYFPAGVYLTDPITLGFQAGHRLVGPTRNYLDVGGEGRAVLKSRGTQATLINITGYNTEFEYLVFDGNFTTADVIKLNPTSQRNRFFRCTIQKATNTTGNLIHLAGGVSQIDYTIIDDCVIVNDSTTATNRCNVGILVDGTNAFLNYARNNRIGGCATGVSILNQANINLYDNDFFNITSRCIHIGNGFKAMTIEGNYTEVAGINFIVDQSTSSGDNVLSILNNIVNAGNSSVLSTHHPTYSRGNRYSGSVQVDSGGQWRVESHSDTFTAAASGFFGTGLQSVDEYNLSATADGTNFVQTTNIRNVRGQRQKRIYGSLGTAWDSGEFVLSAGWGTTASVGTILATDSRGSFTITSAGTGQAANPTITVTFADGAWTSAPFVVCTRRTGAQMTVPVDVQGISTTGFIISFLGTPVAAQTYSFTFMVQG